MVVAALLWLPVAIPTGLCILFLAAAVAMSWTLACLELAALRRRQAAPRHPGAALGGLLESAFVFAAAAGTVVLFLPGLRGLHGFAVSPSSASRGTVLFLAAAVLLGLLRAVHARSWMRRCVLPAFLAAVTALLYWASREAIDAGRSFDPAAAAGRPGLSEPLLLVGLSALCLFPIVAFLRLALDALRERRRDGTGGPMVRP